MYSEQKTSHSEATFPLQRERQWKLVDRRTACSWISNSLARKCFIKRAVWKTNPGNALRLWFLWPTLSAMVIPNVRLCKHQVWLLLRVSHTVQTVECEIMWNSLFTDNCGKLSVFGLCAKQSQVRIKLYLLFSGPKDVQERLLYHTLCLFSVDTSQAFSLMLT